MGLLGLLALVLAWPTSGVSILIWVGLAILRGALRASAIKRREKVRDILSPLFLENYGAFFRALDIPTVGDYQFTEGEAEQGGRHILNFLSHNPDEAATFIKGLERWRTKGSASLCDPVTAALDEKNYSQKREIHLTAYRAIEAIMTNNKSLQCYRMVDYGRVVEYKMHIELQGLMGNSGSN